MYWDVIKVSSAGTRCLAVSFADGLTGVVEIDRSFCTGVFEPLCNDAYIAEAGLQNGVVTWPSGLDLAPDTMYQEIKRSPERRYRIVR